MLFVSALSIFMRCLSQLLQVVFAPTLMTLRVLLSIGSFWLALGRGLVLVGQRVSVAAR